jgi:hypothetical protein
MHHFLFQRGRFLTALLILCLTQARSQVNIRERIEIKPSQPSRSATVQTLPAGTLFVPLPDPNQLFVQTYRPCIITAACSLPAYDPANNIPSDWITLLLECTGAPQGTYTLGATGVNGIDTQTVTFNASSCATMHIGQSVAGWGGGESLFGQTVVSVTATTATFELSGEWRNNRPITATVTLTAQPDTLYELASLDITANPSTITQCTGSATITIHAIDKRGLPYSGISCNETEMMTVSVPPTSHATLEYPLSMDSTVRGKELTLRVGYMLMVFRWNYEPGDPPGPLPVTVTSQGKSAQTIINLTVDPEPSYLTADVSPGEVRHNMKSVISAQIVNGCGQTEVPVAGTTFKFEIMDLPQFGYLYDPATGAWGTVLEGVAHDRGIATVEYRAYGDDPPGVEDIPLRITVSDGSVGECWTDFYVEPNEIRVTATPNPIHFGETAQLTIEKNNRDGTYSPIPGEWQTAFQLVQVDSTGALISPDSTQVGSTVYGAFQTATYQAYARTNEPDSVDVAILVTTVDPDVIPSKVAPGKQARAGVGGNTSMSVASKGSKGIGGKNRISTDELPDLGLGLPYQGVGRVVVKKQTETLDHFLVLLSRDTIGYQDACVFFVIARDANNKEVTLDSGRVVTFSVDSSQYGSYLLNNSIRVDTGTIQVPYGLARAGEVQYVSDGIDPLLVGAKTLNFQVCLKDDQTKNGVARLTIEGRAIISLRFSKSELKPLGDAHNKKADPTCVSKSKEDTCRRVIDFSKADTCTLVLSVKEPGGKGIANYPFWIKTGVRDSSGGHDHSTGRPTGWLVTSDKDTLKLYRGKTDTTGRTTFKYLCSGFGGFDSVYAEGLTKKDTATLTILVRMAEFDSLESGAHYVLIGQYGTGNVSSKHRMNHFGTANLITKLKALADTAYSKKEYRLRFNDMSLIHGGPFDIRNNWNCPHQKHREGVSVDVDDSVETSSGRKVITKEQIYDWLKSSKKREFSIGKESDHYHVTIQ